VIIVHGRFNAVMARDRKQKCACDEAHAPGNAWTPRDPNIWIVGYEICRHVVRATFAGLDERAWEVKSAT